MKTYTIKPLKWEKNASEKYWQSYRASVPMGSYTVERNREDFKEENPWGPWKMRWCFDDYYDEGEREVSSMKEGKEAAWQDWLTRIMPALDVVEDRSLEGEEAKG